MENARLYGQLRVKADEIERLRQFSDSVVESLSDGLVVDRPGRPRSAWNRVRKVARVDRERAIGRRVSGALQPSSFVDPSMEARRDSPVAPPSYRVPLAGRAEQRDAPGERGRRALSDGGWRQGRLDRRD